MCNFPNKWRHLFRACPWIVFGILSIFTYAKFVQTPYIGFEFSRGVITLIHVPIPQESIQVGDQLVEIGEVKISEFMDNTYQTIFDGARMGDVFRIVVNRSGETKTIEWKIPGLNRVELLQRLNSFWWLPYIFWMAGIATFLLIRPKNINWLLLIAFFFLTAIWLAAGSGPSRWHIWKSAIVLRSTIWLCLPVYLHFHWRFPKPLKRLPLFVWIGVYSFGILFSISEWFNILPTTAYYSGFSFVLVGSLAILVAHAIFQKDLRRDISFLGLAVLLTVLPLLVIPLFVILKIDPPRFVDGGSLLGLPALPGAYFFVAYRRQFREYDRRMRRFSKLYAVLIVIGTAIISAIVLIDYWSDISESIFFTGLIITFFGAFSGMTGFTPFLGLAALTGSTYTFGGMFRELEIRANRLLTLYLFIIIAGTFITVCIIVTDSLLVFPGEGYVIGIMTMLLTGMITLVGYAPFQTFVDRYILGIQLPLDQLLETYSERITRSLDKSSLIALINNDVLSSLFVRQSALLRTKDGKLTTVFYKNGISDQQISRDLNVPLLLSLKGKYRPESLQSGKEEFYQWIRLILPLDIEGETIGLWLLGRRDPDDLYTIEDISVLQSIANQTAIALMNIDQTERLRVLYQANIERSEIERAQLARGLHDEVLNELAVLPMSFDQVPPPKFKAGYQTIIYRLRQMISGLRPAMLNYGLPTAFDELIDNLATRARDNLEFQNNILATNVKFDDKVEVHVYRIIQQACENALRHAQAKSIIISGSCNSSGIQLTVEDDGIGFSVENELDFQQLLADKHYGIIGMYERAYIIGAKVWVTSSPGEGTKIRLEWHPNHQE